MEQFVFDMSYGQVSLKLMSGQDGKSFQGPQSQIGNKICPQIENYHVLSLVTGVLVVSLKGVQTKHIYRASEYVTVFSHHRDIT
jgi:hypothetical protein